MKERPILFSTEMVQAILEGRKTMTRRIVKPQPDDSGLWDDTHFPRSLDSRLKNWNGQTEYGESREWVCPYGTPGDLLWVREKWENDTGQVNFYAGNSEVIHNPAYVKLTKWKPSIHLKRKDSRITLKIINIRVERLQDISQEDARKEGVSCSDSPIGPCYKDYHSKQFNAMTTARISFRSLWESINGKGSWDQNPWVWVIEFKRI